MKKGLLLITFALIFSVGVNAQWATFDSNDFTNFPAGFSQSGFSSQGYGAETGGSSDKCAYDKNVGASPSGYVSVSATLDALYEYRFTFYMKRAQTASCGVTFMYDTTAGNSGTSVSSEFTPPKRSGTQAGDEFVSDVISGDGNTYFLIVAVTTGNSTDVKLRIDGYKLERQLKVLPITLASFSGREKSNEVNLSWTTAQEINNKFFSIERANTDKSFTEIGEIKGLGDSNTFQNYSFVDVAPQNGSNLYRLKQTDIDGAFTYSDVIVVEVRNGNNTLLIPSLVDDMTTIKFNNAVEADIEFNIFNMNGQMIYSNQIKAGSVSFDVNTIDFAKGAYFVKFEDQTINTLRFVKL